MLAPATNDLAGDPLHLSAFSHDLLRQVSKSAGYTDCWLLCLDCPRPWHIPPFLSFVLPIHIRDHNEKYAHHLVWWCWVDCSFDCSHVEALPIPTDIRRGRGDQDESSPPAAAPMVSQPGAPHPGSPSSPPPTPPGVQPLYGPSSAAQDQSTTGPPAQVTKRLRQLSGAATQVTAKKKGGRRPGAGAPKGNKNAWKEGRYAANQRLRRALTRVPEEVRAELMPYIREGAAAIERRIPLFEPLSDKVTPFPTSSSSSSTEQSDRIQDLAMRMTSHGFYGAQGFLRQHIAHLREIAPVVEGFDGHSDAVYVGLESPGATLNQVIHLTIAEGYGTSLHCPHCRWKQHEKGEEQVS